MDSKKSWLGLPLGMLLLSLFVHSCGGGDRDVEDVIRQRVSDRTTALTNNLLEDCREDILDIAIKRADSLLIDRARRLQRMDGRPPKPRRPGAPPIKELSAPLPLRPLFPFEIRFDLVLRDSLRQDSLRLDSIDRGWLPDPVLMDSLGVSE